MATLDVETLLQPLAEDAPCGPNLEYDASFIAFEQASRGKPEQQYGDTIIPAEDPNWLEVRQLGTELITRTKDLRVACVLARALLLTEGFSAFEESLALVRGYIERYWPTVHPQLDPEDDNDPAVRVNTLSSLSDQSTTIKSLRSVPMVSSRMLGHFSLRHLNIARGEIPPAADEDAPNVSTIEGAFNDADLEQLRTNTNSLRLSLEHTDAIESVLTQQVGAARAVSLDGLRHSLREIYVVLEEHLSRRDAELQPEQPAEAAATADEAGAAQAPAARLTGEIRSREDVIKAIDKICQYYARHEPSSPLPLLLKRAKRLASKSFLEIVQDLSPEAVAQIQALGGVDSDGSEG
jgi:type VI secretion system protein ImpA